ncbi:MAG: FkbM family methyltransferase [Clostridia bacterium]|nr:FkbM family methyltransferase [Clostridia bacterium]
MTDNELLLPEYPVKEDMWDILARESRPIVVYGMGNGADKLFLRLEKYGVGVSDVFASDGFVRGHSFRGYRVKTLSEIRESYADFVVLLSFASSRDEVIDMLLEIDGCECMLVPDMPVAGEEYFDREHYNAHYGEILSAYSALADDASREVFAAVVNYKLTGRLSYLMRAVSTKGEMYSLLPREKIARVCDLGAYNGDTVREALEYFPALRAVTALEPDPKNFKRLTRYAEGVEGIDLECVNAAAWSECRGGEFISSGNRNSSVTSTASHEHKDTAVELKTVDCLGINPDYIKYDVEGAELEALLGSGETILRARPSLLVSIYHRSGDIYSITNMLREKYPFYDLYIRRLRCIPAWELNLILIRNDL